MASKEKELKVLNHKIDKYNEKINNFIKHGISDRKLTKMEGLRDIAIAKRDALLAE